VRLALLLGSGGRALALANPFLEPLAAGLTAGKAVLD